MKGRREFGDAWWQAGLRRRLVVAGLLFASTTGYLAGAALLAGVRGSFLEPAASRNVDPGWTVLTPSVRTSMNEGTDVVLSPTGPWAAELVGFDHSQIRSVVYWIRDARRRWRASQVVENEPFVATVRWWEGDNSGYEAVTAHVTMRSGKVVKDPGGWHWIDGRHADPEGSTAVHLNADGSAEATYTPAFHGSVISAVQFWLRGGGGHWRRVGTATVPRDGAYSIPALAGTQVSGWNASDAAVSVHVVWPNGTEFVDPDPWVWSRTFAPASPPPTARAAPTAALPPAPAPKAEVAHAPEPTPAPNDPYVAATAAGASAVCADGSLSYSHTRGGACSEHQGVRWWTGRLGPAGPGDD